MRPALAAALLLQACASVETRTAPAPKELKAAEEPSLALSSDDAGAVVVAYTLKDAILAQKFSPAGEALWGEEGLEVCKPCSSPGRLSVERGNGGWYALWREPEGERFAWKVERFSDNGLLAWTKPANAGTFASPEAGMDYTATADGSLLLAWNETAPPLALVKLSTAGTVAWRREFPPGRYQLPKLDWDETGGAYLSYRQIGAGDRGLRLQHYSAAGEPLWEQDLGLYDGGGYKSPALMFGDAHQGVIMAWEDGRRGTIDVYSQRVSSAGAVLWVKEGLPLSPGEGSGFSPAMAPDGKGGVHVAWIEDLKDSRRNIRVQHINGEGTLALAREGLPASPSGDNQGFPMAAMDGEHGAFLCWYEARLSRYGLYCQRSGESGPAWSADVAAAESDAQMTGLKLVSDGKKGAVAAWKSPAAKGWEVRLQRIGLTGRLGWKP